MQTKEILMFTGVAILVGSLASMTTTSEVFAPNTGNSNTPNANSNTNTNGCAENGSAADSGEGGGATDEIAHLKFDPCDFGNESIDNPYFTLTPGTTFKYESETEEGTEEIIV